MVKYTSTSESNDSKYKILIVLVFIALFFFLTRVFVDNPQEFHEDNIGYAIHSTYPSFSEPISAFSSIPITDFTQGTSRNISFNITDDATYNVAYMSVAGGAWQPVTLRGTVLGTGWISGTASGLASIPSANITPGNSNNNYIIIYSCTKNLTINAWTCHDNRWQLREFTTTKQNSSNNSGSSDLNLIYAINSGGSAFTSDNGISYEADRLYTGGSPDDLTQYTSIPLTRPYDTERWGDFAYNLPVTNGNYQVTLQFAESYYNATNARRFHVDLEGQRVLTDVDIFALAGGFGRPYDRTWNITVSDSNIDIDLVSGSADSAKISGIIVRGTGSIPGVCTGSSTQACNITNGTGTQVRICNNGNWSGWGTCSYSSCNNGYLWDGTNCIVTLCTGSSTQPCTIANGTGTQSRSCINYYNWSTWGSCTVSSCNSGFIISGNSCIVGTVPSNCVHFDGVCPTGCTGYDIDCHDSIAELNLPIPSADSYTNIIYIDPVLGSASNNGLTPSTALKSWRNIASFNSNTAYLQKRGTTDTMTTSFSIHTTVSGVLLGAYGDTSLPRPIIYQQEPSYEAAYIRLDGDNSTIRDLVLRTRGSCAAISSRNDPWVRFLTIYNVAIEGTNQTNRFWDGFDISNNLGLRIINSSMNYIGEDGFWISDVNYVEVGFSSVENVNQRYWDSSARDDHCFWTPDGTNLDAINVTTEDYSTGDAIQFERVEHAHVHHNYIDKNSPNKHAFISNNWGTITIFENNYIHTAYKAGGTHISGMHLILRNNVWEYTFANGETINNPQGVQYGGFYGWATPLEMYNNIFINHYKPVNSRGTSGTIVTNNIFYNVYGLGWNNWDGDKAADVDNNIFLHSTGGSSSIMDPVFYDYNEFMTTEGFRGVPAYDGTHSFVGNPLFVSENTRTLSYCTGPALSRCVLIPNFHLQTGSPARGKGTSTMYNMLAPLAIDKGVLRDLDGNVINKSKVPNLGPYQN